MVPDRLIFLVGDAAGLRLRRGFRARMVLQIRNHLLCRSSVPPALGNAVEWREAGFSDWRDVDANNPCEVATVMAVFPEPEQMRGRPRIGE